MDSFTSVFIKLRLEGFGGGGCSPAARPLGASLGATVRNLVATATRRPGFVPPGDKVTKRVNVAAAGKGDPFIQLQKRVYYPSAYIIDPTCESCRPDCNETCIQLNVHEMGTHFNRKVSGHI
jgi:hypothetical protein